MKKIMIISITVLVFIILGITIWKSLGYLVYRYPDQKGDYVVLVHGLWSSPLAMMKIGERLVDNGYNVINVGYPSSEIPIKEISREYFQNVIQKNCIDSTKKIHFVTHSMGGIVVRDYIGSPDASDKIGRVVMLAPPNRGSEIIDNFKGVGILEKIIGPAGMELGTSDADTPIKLGNAKVPTGIIIGTGKTFPLLDLFIENENDGMVSVENAKLGGMRDFKISDPSHTMITFDSNVITMILRFLKTEKFS